MHNIDQNNPYPIYLGVGLVVATSLSYYLFNRLVTCCKKVKTQAIESIEQPNSPLYNRDFQDTSTLPLNTKTPLQSKFETWVSQFETNNYQKAISNIQTTINNKAINDSETAIFLADLLRKQLDRIGPINNKTSAGPNNHIIHDYILNHLLKNLIQLDKIEDNQFLSDLGIYLIDFFPNIYDSVKLSILEMLKSIVKHKLNNDVLTKITNFCVNILKNNDLCFHKKNPFSLDILNIIFKNNKTFYEALPEKERDQIKAFYT